MCQITCSNVTKTIDLVSHVVGSYPIVLGQVVGAGRVFTALGLGALDVLGLAICAGAAKICGCLESSGWTKWAEDRANMHCDSLKERVKQLGWGALEFTGLKLLFGVIYLRCTRIGKDETLVSQEESILKVCYASQVVTALTVPILGAPSAVILATANMASVFINGSRYCCMENDDEALKALKGRISSNMKQMAVFIISIIPFAGIPAVFTFICCCPKDEEDQDKIKIIEVEA